MHRRVYPRVYGETRRFPRRRRGRRGLSPRVRGNPTRPVYWSGQAGSIPACTGKPGRNPRARPGTKVYPRVYGET